MSKQVPGLFDAKGLARRVLPAKVRSFLRMAGREFPHWIRDVPVDFREWITGSPDRIPPEWLRRRVSLTSSRAEFLEVGGRLAADALQAYHAVRAGQEAYGTWLDFGCGVGRIFVHLKKAGIQALYGVDPDRGAIHWLQRRYGEETFRVSSKLPPLPFPGATFDVVLAISIFTHMEEAEQLSWLSELSRILKPGGLLIASTHGSDLLVTRDDLTPEQIERLHGSGFLFAPGRWTFNEGSAFHSVEYMNKAWSTWFSNRLFLPRGLGQYQDLSVWQKLTSPPTFRSAGREGTR